MCITIKCQSYLWNSTKNSQHSSNHHVSEWDSANKFFSVLQSGLKYLLWFFRSMIQFSYSSVENSALFFFVLHLSHFFSYSWTFHVAAYLKTCHLRAFWGMHSYISTIQGIWYRESWAIQRHTACALTKQKKNVQIDPDIEFEEFMQEHDWSRKTGLTPLSLESESCPKFQYLLPSQDFSSLVPSSFFRFSEKNWEKPLGHNLRTEFSLIRLFLMCLVLW